MLAPTCLLMSLHTAKQHRSDLLSCLASADMSVQRSESSLPILPDTCVRPDGGMAKWSQSFPLRRLGHRKPALSEPPRWMSSASSTIQATSYLSLSGRVTSRPSSHGHTSSTNRLSACNSPAHMSTTCSKKQGCDTRQRSTGTSARRKPNGRPGFLRHHFPFFASSSLGQLSAPFAGKGDRPLRFSKRLYP